MTDTDTDNSPKAVTPSKGKAISKSKVQKGKAKQQNEDAPKKGKGKKAVDKSATKEKQAEQQKKKESKKTQCSVQKKESKKVRKRKEDECGDGEEKTLVQEYMRKQNRPYNILNIYDNLHAKVKKPLLECILTALTQEGDLTCKQFGKNKVYYPNQKNMDAPVDHINELSEQFNALREQEKELSDRHKRLTQDCKKLLSKKTIQQIETSIEQTTISIAVLKQKINRVGNTDKMDEKVVAAMEKRENMLKKQLNNRRKLVKTLLDQWSQILEKKRDAVAQLMGVEL